MEKFTKIDPLEDYVTPTNFERPKFVFKLQLRLK